MNYVLGPKEKKAIAQYRHMFGPLLWHRMITVFSRMTATTNASDVFKDSLFQPFVEVEIAALAKQQKQEMATDQGKSEVAAGDLVQVQDLTGGKDMNIYTTELDKAGKVVLEDVKDEQGKILGQRTKRIPVSEDKAAALNGLRVTVKRADEVTEEAKKQDMYRQFYATIDFGGAQGLGEAEVLRIIFNFCVSFAKFW